MAGFGTFPSLALAGYDRIAMVSWCSAFTGFFQILHADAFVLESFLCGRKLRPQKPPPFVVVIVARFGFFFEPAWALPSYNRPRGSFVCRDLVVIGVFSVAFAAMTV